MEKIVILRTTRDDHDIRESAKYSYSVEQIMDILSRCPKDAKMVFSNDKGYTFGTIDSSTIRIVEVETKEEEEERIRKEEEEEEILVCPDCESDNIYWSVRGYMRCVDCDAKFKKGKKIRY